jgi:hypothetical protein
MNGAAEPFSHPLLRAATPRGWIAQACDQPDVLIDHAN